MSLLRPAFRPQFTGDRQVDQAQRDADVARQTLVRGPIAFGRFAFDTASTTKDISFAAATAKRVLHGLALPTGATPGGIFPVYTSAACTFYVSAWDEKSVTVVPSATCTGRLWVFP